MSAPAILLPTGPHLPTGAHLPAARPVPTALPVPDAGAAAPPAWPVAGFDPGLIAGLNRLRLLALACRAARRLDVFSACALLALDRGEATRAFATALLGALPQALGRTPVLHAPGSRDIAFDEAWILRLLQAIRGGQGDSIAFLIASRVRPCHRRQIAFLARGLAEGLDTI